MSTFYVEEAAAAFPPPIVVVAGAPLGLGLADSPRDAPHVWPVGGVPASPTAPGGSDSGKPRPRLMRMISSLRRPAPSAAAPLPVGGAGYFSAVAEQPSTRPRARASMRQRPPGELPPIVDGAGSSAGDRRSPPPSNALGRPSVSSSRKTLLTSSPSGTFTAPATAPPLPPALKAAGLQFER